jgi:hypothetical protein
MTPRGLHGLLRWYRHEWHAEMGSGRIHVRDTDEGGDLEWHQLFAQIVELPGGTTPDGEPDTTGSSSTSLPLRYHLHNMARNSARGRRRAEYLFSLACHDFDVRRAGLACSAVAGHDDAEDWLLDYAEMSLGRLYRATRDPAHVDGDGRPRRYLPRVGKSESQHRAEEAVA